MHVYVHIHIDVDVHIYVHAYVQMCKCPFHPLFPLSLSFYLLVVLLCPNVGVCSYYTCLWPLSLSLSPLFHLCPPILFLCLIASFQHSYPSFPLLLSFSSSLPCLLPWTSCTAASVHCFFFCGLWLFFDPISLRTLSERLADSSPRSRPADIMNFHQTQSVSLAFHIRYANFLYLLPCSRMAPLDSIPEPLFALSCYTLTFVRIFVGAPSDSISTRKLATRLTHLFTFPISPPPYTYDTCSPI